MEIKHKKEIKSHKIHDYSLLFEMLKERKVVSPLTHVKDEEAEGAEHDGTDLLPVDGETVPLRLVLRAKKGQTDFNG